MHVVAQVVAAAKVYGASRVKTRQGSIVDGIWMIPVGVVCCCVCVVVVHLVSKVVLGAACVH